MELHTAAAQALRVCRARKGMSQEALAKAAALTTSALSRIETGLASPNTRTLGRLAAVLGVELFLEQLKEEVSGSR